MFIGDFADRYADIFLLDSCIFYSGIGSTGSKDPQRHEQKFPNDTDYLTFDSLRYQITNC